jgi:hypothetical protein
MDTLPADHSPDRITPGKALENTDRSTKTGPSADFEAYMQGQSKTGTPGTPLATGGQSLMDVARAQSAQPGTPSVSTLMNQSKGVQDSLGVVDQQLKTPNLKFKRPQALLLRNKLQDANEHTRSAAAKLGLETPPPPSLAHGSPLDRFISYVNDSQNQMLAVQKKLNDISARGDTLNPADLLTIQVKMNLAQQEIEYSSTLLGKVISSLTQIMNIQL